MILTPEVQSRIDSMSYYEILNRRRFDRADSEWWQGEVGAAMEAHFLELSRTLPQDEKVATSKQIGWES